MHQIDVWRFYQLGRRLRRLEDLSSFNDTERAAVLLEALLWVGNTFNKDDDEIGAVIPKSKRAALRLFAVLKSEELLEADDPKHNGSMHDVANAYRRLEQVLSVELDDVLVVATTPTTLGYSTVGLLVDPRVILPKSVGALLTGSAALDFILASQCLVYDQWTAACLHILRATETVMLDYLSLLGGSMEDPTTWAALIGAIGSTGRAPKHMVSRLHRLRDHERNNLMHPGRFVDEDECWEVFDHCKHALVAMLRHMRRLGCVPDAEGVDAERE